MYSSDHIFRSGSEASDAARFSRTKKRAPPPIAKRRA